MARLRRLPRACVLGAFLALGAAPGVSAAPWAETGNVTLRHDLQRLADAGVINGVQATWPVPWRSVTEALRGDLEELESRSLAASARRVRNAARRALVADGSALRFELGGADAPSLLRGYADQPRAEAEASVAFENRSGIFAGRLKITAANDPADDDEVRIDDSFISWQLGNWWVGAGAIERWWGPGNDGSLILGNNARPVPGLMAERASADSFDHPWLSWLGPWRLSTFVGQLGSDRTVSDALLHGMRVTFKPAKTLTVGLSRTAQFGGDGNTVDAETIGDILVGNTNQEDIEDNAANQLAGWDVRWAPRWFDFDSAFYLQRIGEDFSGGIPTRQMTLVGTELAGAHGRDATWRIYFEYADTRSAGTKFLDFDMEAKNISFNNRVFPSGYTFEGRVLGHSIDGDSRLATVGGLYVTGSGHSIDWLVRDGDLNLDGTGRSSVAPNGAEIQSIRVGWRLPWSNPRLTLRAGADELSDLDGSDTQTDGFGAVTLEYQY